MRRRLVLIATAAVAAALALLTAGFYMVLSKGLERDADLVLRSRAAARLSTLDFAGSRMLVEDLPLDEAVDENIWVFDSAGRPVVQGRASKATNRAVASLAGVSHATFRDAGPVRLFSVPATSGGTVRGTVVVSVSRVPYEHSERIALLAAVLLDGFVLVLVLVLTRRVVSAALGPVAVMTRQALEWSEHDLDRRFALGPPRDELTYLAANLDVLLGRLAANLRHERRLSAEIAHELRTPLARLRAEAELAVRRERSKAELRRTLTTVVSCADELAMVIETLLEFSRTEIDASSTGCHASDVMAAAASGGEPGPVTLTIKPPREPIRVGCEADLVLRMLSPLVRNAMAYGSAAATLTAVKEDGGVVFVVADDGPGVRPGEEEAIFTPAARGTAGRLRPGSGLGLALSRRLARAAGGDVVAIPASGAGGVFQLRLPSA